MLQETLVILIFLAALIYLGRLIYRHFTTDSGCPSGCGSCGTIDFEKIEQQMKERNKASSSSP